MKITVIGTGNVGRALGTSFVRAGHDVTLVARDAAKTRQVATEIGAQAGDDVRGAAQGADVIVLAIPYAANDAVTSEIAPVAEGKVVVDVANPLTPDYSGLANPGGPSSAEQVAKNLPGSPVVKAFNTMFSSIQGDPGALGTQVDGLFAADDDRARATIAELMSSIGIRPVHVGPLQRARELEALGFLNIGLQVLHGGDWRSAVVIVGAPAAATQAPVGARS